MLDTDMSRTQVVISSVMTKWKVKEGITKKVLKRKNGLLAIVDSSKKKQEWGGIKKECRAGW